MFEKFETNLDTAASDLDQYIALKFKLSKTVDSLDTSDNQYPGYITASPSFFIREVK